MQYASADFSVPKDHMQFISEDLIGEFHPRSSAGNCHTLTAIDILTGYVFCPPIKSRYVLDVIKSHLDHDMKLYSAYCIWYQPMRSHLYDSEGHVCMHSSM